MNNAVNDAVNKAMSAPQIPATARSVPSRRIPWTTPRRLQAALVGISFAALLFLLVLLVSVVQRRNAVKTVGKDTAPSIIAAQHIRSGMADMDANAANELIAKPGENSEAVRQYEMRRTEVVKALVGAAENITYDTEERTPIEVLLLGIGIYHGQIERARLLHAQGKEAEMLVMYREATRLMHETLLPASVSLDTANKSVLEKNYQSEKQTAAGTTLLVLCTGGVLLAVLIAAQVFLSRRMRRLLNPSLFAATLLTATFLLMTFAKFSAQKESLKVAKEDAFDSIHALWQACAIAYDANAEESRWLLDRERAAQYEQAFLEKAGTVVTVPRGQNYKTAAANAVNKQNDPNFKGMLAIETRNITFPGESAAAIESVGTFGEYLVIDRRLRELENAGRHTEAVALCVGNREGESNWAFEQFDNALGRTLDINQKEFDQAVERGFRALAGHEIASVIVIGLVIALAYFGIRPRLMEYAL